MRRRAGLVVLVVAAAVVAAGTHLLLRPPAVAVADALAAPATTPATVVAPPAPQAAAPATEQVPVSLTVEAIGIQAPVVPVLAAPGGALTIPEDPGTFGWWAAGAAPGSPTGSVVVVAHVDAAAYGAGPMSDLIRAPMQTAITVQDAAGGLTRYALSERRSLPKSELPADLFTLGGAPRLVLITCGGTFDRATGHYSDNVVMIATPA
ncbi:class F sortase [Cellulomonas xylanilytica]|uniref:class F sortase n=1 Tax=Cellulomonas xylanilytica TaxID=233583 RepID=UPI001649A0A9|nr:class F sortase [Cellulomonas xylanilytica]